LAGNAPKVLYRRRPTGQAEVDSEFRRVEDAFQLLGPLASGLTVIEATLASGNNTVFHRLGRVPLGRFLVYSSAASTIFDVSGTDTEWVLNSSAATTVKLIFI